MLQPILVPLDGSDRSRGVFAHLDPLLRAEDAQVHLLFVIDPQHAAEGEQHAGRPLPLRVDAAQRWLREVQQDLERRGGQARVHVDVGDPAEAILARAEGLGPDGLVAMATHGRSGLSRWVRGSVAERVLRRCPVPLLLGPARAEGTTARAFQRILVPLDGSDRSARILPRVSALARRFDAEVVLLQAAVVLGVSPEVPGPLPVVAPAPDTLEEALEPARQRLLSGGVARVRVRGEVATDEAGAILDVAEDEGADLIAMTTHGRSGLDRWLFGSVAEKVLRHAATPLLVERTGAVVARTEAPEVGLEQATSP